MFKRDKQIIKFTVYIISETVFPVNHLAGTSKTKLNNDEVQLTTQIINTGRSIQVDNDNIRYKIHTSSQDML